VTDESGEEEATDQIMPEGESLEYEEEKPKTTTVVDGK